MLGVCHSLLWELLIDSKLLLQPSNTAHTLKVIHEKLQLCSLGLCAGEDRGVRGCSQRGVQVVWEVLFLLLSLLHSTHFCFAGDQDLVWKLGMHGR